MQFFSHLSDLFRAGYPVLMLRTYEYTRVYEHLKAFCREEDYLLYRWNCAEGLAELGLTIDTVLPVGDRIHEPTQVLVEIERRLDSREREIFVLEGIYDFFFQADVKVLLRKLAIDIPKYAAHKHCVLINPVPEVPKELARFVPVLEVPLPDAEELGAILDRVAQNAGLTVEGGLHRELIKAAEGLTAHEAQLAFKLAAVRDGFGHWALETVRNSVDMIPERS